MISIHQMLWYSIDRNTDLERYFNIDANSGVITTAKPLDRETNAVHNITVLAMESQNPSQIGRGYVAITILDINDNAPEFAMDYETTVCENAELGKVWIYIPNSLMILAAQR
ncbi:UNVERIFIED_CONTAM: Cadherin-7 [Gekko kuhli]